jgi:methylmalonyl-CoA mutase
MWIKMVRKQQCTIRSHQSKQRYRKVQTTAKLIDCCAKTGKGNLLEIAVDAARNRTTLGEISDALETVYGRYKAQIKSFSGVYSKEIKDDKSFEKNK